jgi:hypothetical protein
MLKDATIGKSLLDDDLDAYMQARDTAATTTAS